MTLIIENADSKILKVIESLKALKPELEIRHKKKRKKPSKKLLEALKESEEMEKNPHLYPSYSTMQELRAALESE